MAKRRNGVAVIAAESGVEKVPAYVRRFFNLRGDWNEISPYVAKDARYILIGGSRVIEEDIEMASKPMPEVIERAPKSMARLNFFGYWLT